MADSKPERPVGEAASPHTLLALYRQLQRRHVIRTAALYVAGALALVQVVPNVQQSLDLPPVLNTLVTLGLIVGFLPACILAWAFDLTPPRVLRADSASADPRDRRLSRLLVTLATLVFVGTASAAWLVWQRHARGAAAEESARVALAAAAAFPPDHVAVLPFQDIPGGPGAYLGKAMAGQLIDQLSRVPGLHVVQWGGTAGYGTDSVKPDSIGRALSVGTIISGSVLDDGTRVRVTARATDAATGEVLESVQLERPSGELLRMLDDVVREVAAAIRQRIGLAVEVRRWQAGTRDQEAWRLVQQARQIRDDAEKLRTQGDNAGALAALGRADSLLAQAEGGDPRWDAPALERGWGERRVAFIYLSAHGGSTACRAAVMRGIGHADRVLARLPGNARALELRGLLEWWISQCGTGGSEAATAAAAAAQRDLQAAVRTDLRLPRAWGALAEVLMSRGDWAGAHAAAQRAYEEDAYLEDVVIVLNTAFRSAFQLRDDAGASAWCAELERRKPGEGPTVDCRLRLMAWGPARPDPATAWRIVVASGAAESPTVAAGIRDHSELLVAAVLARAGLRDSARAVIERVRARSSSPSTIAQDEAQVCLLLGERARALHILRAYAAEFPAAGTPWLRDREFAALNGTLD